MAYGGRRVGARRPRGARRSAPTTGHGPVAGDAEARRGRAPCREPTSAATSSSTVTAGEVAQGLGRGEQRARVSRASTGSAWSTVNEPMAVRRRSRRWAPPPSAVPRSAARRADVGARGALDLDREAARLAAGSPTSKRWTVTGRASRSTSMPSRASSWRRLPSTWIADTIGGTWRMSPVSAAAAARTSASVDAGHVPRAGDLAGRVERGGGGAEHDHARVGLGGQAEVAQQPGDLADAEQQHAGGVGVERAGVADLAGAEHAAGLGDDVVARPAGLLVDDRQPVRAAGRAFATATSSSWIWRRTSSRRAAPRPTSSGLKSSSGVRFTRAWRPMAPWRRVAVLAERLEHLLVVVLAAEGVVVHGGVAEVALAVDRHDRDQLEPVVVDASRAPRRGSPGRAG